MTPPGPPPLQMVRQVPSPAAPAVPARAETLDTHFVGRDRAQAGPLLLPLGAALACPESTLCPSRPHQPVPCPHPCPGLAPTMSIIADCGCPASSGPYSDCAEGRPSCARGSIP